uniref:Uncharacterized protein n=1 Tax=Ananas comosus var. bracteatus TaxID=296719 RepID=A0A6V7QI97_ANACO|nr:unnamed protein product [Ananas comosus var. bracteatus]
MCGEESSGEEALSPATATVALGSITLGSISRDRDLGPVYTSKPASFVPRVPCGEEVLSPASAAIAFGSTSRDWDLGPIFICKPEERSDPPGSVVEESEDVPIHGVIGGGVDLRPDMPPVGSLLGSVVEELEVD